MLAILGLKPAALGATVAATNKRLKLDAANAMQVCPPPAAPQHSPAAARVAEERRETRDRQKC